MSQCKCQKPRQHNPHLLDALESELIALNQDANGVGHELGGHFKNFLRHGGRDKANLRVGGQVAVYVVNLVLEALVEQLIGLGQQVSDAA